MADHARQRSMVNLGTRRSNPVLAPEERFWRPFFVRPKKIILIKRRGYSMKQKLLKMIQVTVWLHTDYCFFFFCGFPQCIMYFYMMMKPVAASERNKLKNNSSFFNIIYSFYSSESESLCLFTFNIGLCNMYVLVCTVYWLSTSRWEKKTLLYNIYILIHHPI